MPSSGTSSSSSGEQASQDMSRSVSTLRRLASLIGESSDKSEKQESQNSKPESGKPSGQASTELVVSGADIAEGIRMEVRRAIDNRIEVNATEEIQQKIRKHYYQKAEKLMKELWRECGKRTGHAWVLQKDDPDYSTYGDNKPYTCDTCGMPNGKGEEYRKKRGLTIVASKLREADKAAGIEYIPD